MTICSPKKLLFLQKSLFLDGAHVQIINLFIKKITLRLSKLPQPYCRLFVSPLSSLPAAYQPCSYPAAETGDFNTALHFVHFSSTFCPFFKFSFQINPNALKRIVYQNSPYIYPGYSFRATKMFQCGEFEKWTNHNLIFISKNQPKNWR